MDRRDFLRTLPPSLAALLAYRQAHAASTGTKAPNIIFFIIDDQYKKGFNFLPEGRYEDGRPRNLTPNLDRLAAEGTIMREFHVPTPICVPSRFSCLTGTYPSRAESPDMMAQVTKEGMRRVEQNSRVMPGQTSLPRSLQQMGYATGAIGKNHVIEDFDEPVRPPLEADPHDPAIKAWLLKNHAILERYYKGVGFDFADRLWEGNMNTSVPKALQHHNLDWMVEGAFNFLDEYAGKKPFFLYFATTVPHDPFADGTAWKQCDPLITSKGFLDKAPNVLPSRESIGQRLREAGLPDDAGDMLWLDDAIGALLKKVDDAGELENTIFVFFNDQGMDGGKFSLYQTGMRTPAVFWAPGRVKAGQQSFGLAASVDFMPTLLEWAGAPIPANIDGQSLAQHLKGEAPSPRDYIYGEFGYARSIRKGPWKYIAFRLPLELQNLSSEQRQEIVNTYNAWRTRVGETLAESPDIAAPLGWDGLLVSILKLHPQRGVHQPHYLDPDQLYNLDEDPNELVNLAGEEQYADILADMKRTLARQAEKLPGTFAEFTCAKVTF